MRKKLSLEERITETPLTFEFRDVALTGPNGKEVVRYDKLILTKKMLVHELTSEEYLNRVNKYGGLKKLVKSDYHHHKELMINLEDGLVGASVADTLNKIFYNFEVNTLNLPLLYNLLELAWEIDNKSDSRAVATVVENFRKVIGGTFKKGIRFSSFFLYGASSVDDYSNNNIFRMNKEMTFDGHKLSSDLVIHKMPSGPNLFFPLNNNIPHPPYIIGNGGYNRDGYYKSGTIRLGSPCTSAGTDERVISFVRCKEPASHWAPAGGVFTPGYKEDIRLYSSSYQAEFSQCGAELKKQWEPFLRALFLKHDVTHVNEVLHWAFGQGKIHLQKDGLQMNYHRDDLPRDSSYSLSGHDTSTRERIYQDAFRRNGALMGILSDKWGIVRDDFFYSGEYNGNMITIEAE